MAKSRPFAYNPGSQIPGTQKFGNLTVGSHDLTPDQSGVQWWNGPDEDLGYVIAQTNVDGLGNPLQPTPTPGVYGSVGFFRTDGKNTTAFINLTNAVSGQNFTTATQCKTWLESNNKWTSWNDFATEAIVAFKTRVLSSGGNFEAETNLENQLNTLGSTLFDSASLIITPNGYKENVLFSVTPSPVGTNLLLRSEEFENSYWNKTRCTISANQEIAPNGTLTADYVVEDNTTGLRYVGVIGVPTTIGQTYTFSFFAKKKDRPQIVFQINEGNAIFPTVRFNFDSQSFTQTTPLMTSSFQSVGNGWFRLIFTRTPTSGTSSVFGIYPLDVNGNYNGTGDGVSRTIIWGAQLEYGSSVGNYIPTTTRQAINETICDLSVIRATTATRVNEQGLVELVQYNLFSYSEDFSNNSNWSKKETTISNNSTVAPNGTMAADKIIGNSGVTYSYIGTLGVNVVSLAFTINSTERVVSFYLKYGGLNRIMVRYGDSSNLNGGAYVVVDLQLGIITDTYGGSFASNFFIEDAGNGWYRVGFTVIMTLSSTNNRFGIGLGDTTKTVGDGVDGVYVWGAQLVDGSNNKPYQPTTDRLNVPRIDYTTGQPAILVEPQRTNLLLRSEEFENASWSKNNSSIIPNVAISPSGLMNADKLIEDNLLANHDIQVLTGGTELRTNSIFVKVGERSRFILWAGASGYMFDLINLTTTPGNNASSITNASIQDYGNGWYRCSITSNAGPNNEYKISLLDNVTSPLTSTPKYQGDGVSGLYIWGAQRENAPSLTSYIPTTTGSVTRNADVIYNTNASTLIGQNEGSVYLELSLTKLNKGGSVFFSFSLNTTNWVRFRIQHEGLSTINIQTEWYVNSVFVNQGNAKIPRSTSLNKILFTYKIGSQVNFFHNGIKLAATNPIITQIPAFTTVELGHRGGGSQINESIKTTAIYKTALTDAQAIKLTTL